MSPAPEFEIPLWAPPANRNSSRTPPSRKSEDLAIPLAVKGLAAGHGVERYLSMLPQHQASSAVDVAVRRGRLLVEAAFDDSDEEWDHRNTGALKRVPSTDVSEVGSDSLFSDVARSEEEFGLQPALPDQACLSDLSDTLIEMPVAAEADLPSRQMGQLVATLRAARMDAGLRRAALLSQGTGAAPPTEPEATDSFGGARCVAQSDTAILAAKEATFAVIVIGLDGQDIQISGLQNSTEVAELCERVAVAFEIPTFAVRLMFNGIVLHMSQPQFSLGMAGVTADSNLTLVKQWGWAKPDVRSLSDLLKQ